MRRKKISLLIVMAMMAGLLSVVRRMEGNSLPQAETGSVEGTVRGADGGLKAEVRVVLEDREGTKVGETVTGEGGRFICDGLKPGVYTVRASAEGWKEGKSKPLVVMAGQRKLVDLVLEVMDRAGTERGGNQHGEVGTIEFDDKPNFTVAGVTEWNNAGMHGSDVSARTSEKLAKDAQALEGPTTSSSAETEKELRETREMAKASLARADLASTHRKLGELDEKLGDPLEAEREFARAARMEPSEENYFAWGTELLLHRADEAAAEVFLRASNAHKESARMLEGLGAALFAEGRVEEAAKKLCEAADLKPKDETAYLFLGRIQKSVVKPLPCAEEKLARFAREQPENAIAHYYYGLTLWRRERASGDSAAMADAETHLAKAAKLDAKFGEASLQLGILHAESGKLDQAIADFQNAVATSPELGEAHYRLGLAYRRTKQEAKAEQEFRVYEKIQKEETAAREKEQKELRQFLIILKEQPAARPN